MGTGSRNEGSAPGGDPPTVEALRERLAGRSITIVHYGEDVPLDEGYRPLRYGQLATWLTLAGAEVVRIAPTFSHLARRQRPTEWSGTETEEGTIELVPTTGYASNRGLDRLRFLSQFRSGTAEIVSRRRPSDLFLIGYPPPGLVRAVRRAAGRRPRVVADIRDLWPDAQIPSRYRRLSSVGAVVGRVAARELRGADGVVAMSARNLERAPADRRLDTIPLSISERLADAANPPIEGPLQVVFVGTFTPLFDFEPMIAGWSRFRAHHHGPADGDRERCAGPVDGGGPRLRMAGDGPLAGLLHRLASGVPGLELLGMIPSQDVPELLGRSDVGVVPLRTGQGGTLTNKVLEYLGTGAYVLHTLDDAVSHQLGDAGRRVEADADRWATAFAELEGRLPELRTGRAERRQRSIDRFGQAAIERRWLTLCADVLAKPA